MSKQEIDPLKQSQGAKKSAILPLSLYLLALLISSSHTKEATAQIIPDNTLPTNSQVQQNCTVCEINGGTVKGVNLFHSFQEFSVPTGGEALFNNSSAIQNILTKVTGNSISHIDGLIRTHGSANLFFINPNGIVFGENANLNIGGSLIASTANSIKFVDGTQFSSQVSQSTPLLTISMPMGLQFAAHPELIQVQSKVTGLQIQANQTLALVGGDISLKGATLKTNGGRLELGSVAGEGLVSLTSTNQGFSLAYDGIQKFGNIQLTAEANVDTSGIGGGEMQIQTGNLQMSEGSRIASLTLGSLPGGNITINATDTIEIIGTGEFEKKAANILDPSTDVSEGRDGFFILSNGSGSTGNFEINTNKLILKNGAILLVSVIDQGNGGNLNINASESIEVIESLLATGNRLQSSGDAGNINIKTKNLRLQNRGSIASSSLGTGKAGNININASESIQLTPSESFYQVFDDINVNTNINSSTLGIADSGNIEISTNQLILRKNTAISAATFGAGNGGNLTINASDIHLIGKEPESFVNALGTASEIGATGNGGNLNINANTLQMQDGKISAGAVGVGNGGNLLINVNKVQLQEGAEISVSTISAGKAGTLTVNAADIQLVGTDINGSSSGFFASSGLSATGAAGDIKVNTNNLQILDRATITVEALGSGNAGNFSLKANSILMDNLSIISGNSRSNSTDTNQEQASINLRSQDLIMRNGSKITTNATGSNVIGGNITIVTDVLAAAENSDISANSTDFRGGKVTITTQGVFGTQFRDQLTPESDITATGASPEFSGTVQINQLSTDPSQGLIDLSTSVIDTDNQVAQGCAAGSKFASRENKFTIIGRGGLPSSPDDLFTGTRALVDLVELVSNQQNNPDIQPVGVSDRIPTEIVEAQGWVVDAKGQVNLVAQIANFLPHGLILSKTSCSTP
ncbi:two-partner secretion domain-containing protein [Anabaena sp. WFMT]|uniref:two-partner secretion domain-containing protein n=1 Tax=Anabaena sp. WFMT TaxID=3449730 RepID=UPI003F2127D9